MYANNAKPLLFLPNGQSLKMLNIEAKKASKNNGSTISGHLNNYTRNHFNCSYNKLHKQVVAISPFIESGTLYLPVNVCANESNLDQDVTIFISISNECITLTGKSFISTPSDCTFKNVKFTDIEMKYVDDGELYSKTCNGWIVNAYSSDCGMYFVSISKTSEGVIVDLYFEDETGHLDAIESLALSIDELCHIDPELPEKTDIFLGALPLASELNMTLTSNCDGIPLITMYDDDVAVIFNADNSAHIEIGDISVSYDTLEMLPKNLTELSLQMARNYALYTSKKALNSSVQDINSYSSDDFCIGSDDCLCSVCLNAMR